MKKIIKIFLFVLCMTTMICVISGCSGTEQNNASESDRNTVTEADKNENNIESETNENESIVSESNTSDNIADNTDNKDSRHILVAYFSATGTTKGVAENIADNLSADLYEIIPSEPYTDDDLDYNNSSSRTSIEMNDKSSRPEIANNVENIEDYDVIFLGYPIWWGEAPHIIYTFMESYDFSGKTIIPFCTSGSSGIGSSAKNLHSTVSDNAVWLDGDRLNGNSSKEDISKWISGLDLDVKAQ